MSNIQKIILALGTIVFVVLIAVFPAKYTTSINNPNYDPKTSISFLGSHNQYIKVERIDMGATSLRGIAIIGATAALWAIVGKKKTD